jgi:DNA-binding GntR family transcriptional regulator
MWSKLLGVSRNTVLAAYEELAASGLIQGAHGSGMFVCAARQKRPGNLLRAAHFPERTAQLPDPDGNGLYINF